MLLTQKTLLRSIEKTTEKKERLLSTTGIIDLSSKTRLRFLIRKLKGF